MYTIDKITLRTPQTTAIKNDLDALTLRVETNENHLNDNDGKIVSLETLTANHTTKLTQLETSINTKANDADVVKLSGTQTINGVKTFNKAINLFCDDNDVVATIKARANKAGYIRFDKSDNNRLGYIGKGGSTTDDLAIGADREHLLIQCRDTKEIKLQGHTRAEKNITMNDENAKIEFVGNRNNNSYCVRLNADSLSAGRVVKLIYVHMAGAKSGIVYKKDEPNALYLDGEWLLENIPNNANAKRVINKKYVDDVKAALKTELKNIGQNAADFAAFKTALASW